MGRPPSRRPARWFCSRDRQRWPPQSSSPPARRSTFDLLMVVARQRTLFTVMLAVAAACWIVGTFTWLVSGGLADAVGWWLAFLVLTIASERLELSRRPAPPPLSQATFVAAVLLILAGACAWGLAGRSALLSGSGPAGDDRLAAQPRRRHADGSPDWPSPLLRRVHDRRLRVAGHRRHRAHRAAAGRIFGTLLRRLRPCDRHRLRPLDGVRARADHSSRGHRGGACATALRPMGRSDCCMLRSCCASPRTSASLRRCERPADCSRSWRWSPMRARW